MITLLIILNFGISIFNSWAVGYSWVETKAVGGWIRFMSWMGATMSAIGFSWSYLVIFAIAAGPDGFHRIPAPYVRAMMDLGYLALLPPLLGSGLAITIDSWAHFWRRKTFGNGALATYNTGVDVYNIYQAFQYAPSAWKNVKELLFGGKSSSKSSSDDDNVAARIAIMLAAAALLLGILTTAALIRTVAEMKARDRMMELSARS